MRKTFYFIAVVTIAVRIGILCFSLETTLANSTALVRLRLGTAEKSTAQIPMVQEALPGEIQGIRSTVISLAAGDSHAEPFSTTEDRVFLVLAGAGELLAGGQAHRVAGETVAHFPIGMQVKIKTGHSAGLDLLILRLTLTPVDRKDLAVNKALNQIAYVKTFKECEPYGEAIKSPTTSG